MPEISQIKMPNIREIEQFNVNEIARNISGENRCLNAFFLYRKEFTKRAIAIGIKMKMTEISKFASLAWKSEKPKVRKAYADVSKRIDGVLQRRRQKERTYQIVFDVNMMRDQTTISENPILVPKSEPISEPNSEPNTEPNTPILNQFNFPTSELNSPLFNQFNYLNSEPSSPILNQFNYPSVLDTFDTFDTFDTSYLFPNYEEPSFDMNTFNNWYQLLELSPYVGSQ
ncbi:18757_t:CDS:1, partial [Gigaspora margarita]